MGSQLGIVAGFARDRGADRDLASATGNCFVTGVAAHGAAFLLIRAIGRPGGDDPRSATGPGRLRLAHGLGIRAGALRAQATRSLAAAGSSELRSRSSSGSGSWSYGRSWCAAFAIPRDPAPRPEPHLGALIASLPTLAADFHQTFKAVLFGYAVGCLAGFLVAILADRVPFLRRGLLPIGNLVSALPIIGIAPIMVMWFGFDWPSKAAVVIVMTFFPMLVNTIAGLASTTGASSAT